MKKIIFAACTLFTLAVQAQTKDAKATIVTENQLKEGRVIYEHTAQFQIRLKGTNPEIESRLPKSKVRTYELLFGNNQSLLQQLPDAAEEANSFSNDDRTIRTIRVGGTEDVVYHNFETGKKISQRELDAKNYLVEDSIKKLTWKLTGESKIILGYAVQKATTQNITRRFITNMENGEIKRTEMPDTVNVVAWFAPNIPIAAGPQFQGDLPGLILELDINNGRSVYKALEISPKVSLNNIKEPKGGKRISAGEFNVAQQKSMEEFRKRMADNGGRITIPALQ